MRRPIRGIDHSAASDCATTTECQPRSAAPDSAHRRTWARTAIPYAKRVAPPALPAWVRPIWDTRSERERFRGEFWADKRKSALDVPRGSRVRLVGDDRLFRLLGTRNPSNCSLQVPREALLFSRAGTRTAFPHSGNYVAQVQIYLALVCVLRSS